MTRSIASHALVLRELRAEDAEDADNSVVLAVLESNTDNTKMIDTIVEELRAFPWVKSVEWAKTDIEPE